MLLRLLDKLEETIIKFLIAAATLLIFVAVVHRYGSGNSANLAIWAENNGYVGLGKAAQAFFVWLTSFDLSWAQELCIYMFVWMAKFGAAYGVRTGIHVGVDVLVNKLGPEKRKVTVMFSLLCGALFTFVVGSMGAKFVHGLYHTDQVTADMEMPSWIIYLCVPLGSYLMCFRFLQVARNFWLTGHLPHHDETQVEGIEVDAPGAGAAGITR